METEPAPPPSPREDSGGPFGFFHLLGGFLLLLILYVISVGPVAKFYRTRPMPKVIDYFYAPVESLALHSPKWRGFFHWYVDELWRAGPTATPPPNAPTNSAAQLNSG
jgi:hypothetical protein